MNRIIIAGGSVIASTLLILVSLTSAVGYRTVRPSATSQSPLFDLRMKRAITGEGNTVLTLDYLGKGQHSDIRFFPRLEGNNTLREIIQKITAMDDHSYQKFVRTTVSVLSNQGNLRGITSQQFITALYQVRDHPQAFFDSLGSEAGNRTLNPNPTFCWFPGCFIIIILAIIWTLIKFNLPTSIYQMSVCFCPND